MGFLELGEVNRRRYGEVPERIEYVPHQHGMRALKALRTGPGYEYPDLLRALARPSDEAPLDEDAVVAFVWLVLLGSGYRYDWDTFDVTLAGLKLSLTDESPSDGQPELDAPAVELAEV